MSEALLELVERMTRADREVDARLWREVAMPTMKSYQVFDGRVMLDVSHGHGERRDWRHPGPYDVANNPPNYTGSIDAALWLVANVRPGADVDLEIREMMTDGEVKRVTDATIYGRAYSEEKNAKAYANSPALAICAAVLRAAQDGCLPAATFKESNDG